MELEDLKRVLRQLAKGKMTVDEVIEELEWYMDVLK